MFNCLLLSSFALLAMTSSDAVKTVLNSKNACGAKTFAAAKERVERDAADGKPVLRAIARREPTGRLRTLPDGRSEPEFAFVHDGWEQVLRIEIRTRRC